MERKYPLYLIFQWHMHQPFYKDPFTQEYLLPWTRLHLTKDYTDMAWHLERYPDIKSVVNFVPSLILQTRDYSDYDQVKEIHLRLTRKRARDLIAEEKIFLLREFFSANTQRIIQQSSRYSELFSRRGENSSESELQSISGSCTDQDFLDLQVWFLLAWTGEELRAKPGVQQLIEKDRDFSENEKDRLLDIHEQAVNDILDRYNALKQKSQIELTASPFAHPILPLTMDSDIARIPMPDVILPQSRFRHPEEAMRQVNTAINTFQDEFGFQVTGMWPSEGSVSEATLDLLSQCGIQHITTDSNILGRSLSRSMSPVQLQPMHLYRPYISYTHQGAMTVFFRDQHLSDLISFRYAEMAAKTAVDDFMEYLERAETALPDDGYPYVAVITMDGENAWEHFEKNGKPFFDELYGRLTETDWIETTTFEEYTKQYPAQAELQWLHPGSWIDADFHIWIGQDEKNLAWDWLNDAIRNVREAEKKGKDVPETVQDLLMCAEGSDWFWWYGDINTTMHDKVFDELFCNILRKIYDEMDINKPDYLNKNIIPTVKDLSG